MRRRWLPPAVEHRPALRFPLGSSVHGNRAERREQIEGDTESEGSRWFVVCLDDADAPADHPEGATTLALPLVDSAAGLSGTANPNAVFGLVSLSFAVSGLVAPWSAGLTYDATGTYAPAFVVAGALGLVAAAETETSAQ